MCITCTYILTFSYSDKEISDNSGARMDCFICNKGPGVDVVFPDGPGTGVIGVISTSS